MLTKTEIGFQIKTPEMAETPPLRESAELKAGRQLNEVFGTLTAIRPDQFEAKVQEYQQNGIITPLLAEKIREQHSKLAHFIRTGINSSTEPLSTNEKISKRLFPGTRKTPQVAVLDKNNLALEVTADKQTLSKIYYGNPRSRTCISSAGFYQSQMVEVEEGTMMFIPLIAVDKEYADGTTPKHERTHVENGLMKAANMAPTAPTFLDALAATDQFLKLSNDGTDEEVFSSPQWDVLQNFANNTVSNEVVAEWMAAEEPEDFKSFVDESLLKKDSGLYNYFTDALGIPPNSEYMRFIWGTYEMNLRHHLESAEKLQEQYANNSFFHQKKEAVGRVLYSKPVEEWNDYLQNEGLLEEVTAWQEFETVYETLAEGVQVADIRQDGNTNTVDQKSADEKEDSSPQLIQLKEFAQQFTDELEQVLKETPEMMTTEYIRAATEHLHTLSGQEPPQKTKN